jgi:hypothetical protein
MNKLFCLALAGAAVVSVTFGQDHLLSQIQAVQGLSGLAVDSVTLLYPLGTVTVVTPGFTASNLGYDTFDLGQLSFPTQGAAVSWSVGGRPQAVFNVPDLKQDSWYWFPDTGTFGPGRVKLYLGAGALEEARPVWQPRLSVSPNPFSASTEIRWNPGQETHFDLAIRDVSGRTVRCLVKGGLAERACRVAWDGLDFDGRPVRAGVYFARLTTASRDHLAKLTLAR